MERKDLTTNDAIALADAILKAAGSGLHHYTVPQTRADILSVARRALAGHEATVTALKQIAQQAGSSDADGDIARLIGRMAWIADKADDALTLAALSAARAPATER